jgi:hypothetical protein
MGGFALPSNYSVLLQADLQTDRKPEAVETPAQAAIAESVRLDNKEAPQREADRTAREDEAERVKLEKARLVNKPKFRP